MKRSANDRGGGGGGGVQGQCPGGDSEPDKVIFNVYNICILCNY